MADTSKEMQDFLEIRQVESGTTVNLAADASSVEAAFMVKAMGRFRELSAEIKGQIEAISKEIEEITGRATSSMQAAVDKAVSKLASQVEGIVIPADLGLKASLVGIKAELPRLRDDGTVAVYTVSPAVGFSPVGDRSRLANKEDGRIASIRFVDIVVPVPAAVISDLQAIKGLEEKKRDLMNEEIKVRPYTRLFSPDSREIREEMAMRVRACIGESVIGRSETGRGLLESLDAAFDARATVGLKSLAAPEAPTTAQPARKRSKK